MAGFLYLLEEVAHSDGEGGPWTKIGMSQNKPEWRLDANLKRGNPRHLNLAAVYQFETAQAARGAEQLAHRHFNQFAHQKEWFAVHWQKIADWCDGEMGWQRRHDVQAATSS